MVCSADAISLQNLASTEFLVTTIVVTSPLPSHPSTAVLQAVLDAHKKYCPEIVGCKTIFAFDGYTTSSKFRLKKGVVTQEIANNYEEYKKIIKKEILLRTREALGPVEIISPVGTGRSQIATFYVQKSSTARVVFIQPDRHQGFALLVRAALEHVTTPYVFIQQHDWAFCALVPLRKILDCMEAATTPSHYIGFNTRWNTNYSTSIISHDALFRQLEQFIVGLSNKINPPTTVDFLKQCSPLFHWLDRPHIARTSVYREHVFGHGYFTAGNFIEDVFGQKMKADMRAAVTSWSPIDTHEAAEECQLHRLQHCGWLGCWIWHGDDASSWSLVHLQGRTFRENAQNGAKRELNIRGGLGLQNLTDL